MNEHLGALLATLQEGDYSATWARASSDDQPDSVPRQEDETAAAIVRHRLPSLRATFSDEGHSRDVMDGPGFDRMLSAIEDPRLRVVVIEKTSRLFADDAISLRIRLAFARTGTLLVDLSGRNLNPEGAIEKTLLAMETYANEEYVQQLRDLVYRSNRRRAEAADHPLGRMPFGVRQVRDVAGNPVKRAFEPDPERIEHLRQIFRWIASGRKSPFQVCDLLTAARVRGVPTSHRTTGAKACPEDCDRHFPEGRVHWDRIQVVRLVRNRLFRGEITWNKKATTRPRDERGQKVKKFVNRPAEEWIVRPSPLGVLLAEPHECDGSAECAPCEAGRKLWDAANDALAVRRGEREKVRKNPPRVLGGLVKCARCGRRMSAFERGHANQRGLFEFRCPTYREKATGGECRDRSHVISERKVWAALSGAVAGKGRPGRVEFTLAAPRDERAALDRLRAALEALDERVARAEDLAVDGDLSKAGLARQKERIAVERTTVESEIAVLEAASTVTSTTAAVAGLRASVAALVSTLQDEAIPLDERRALAARLIAEVVVDNAADGLVVVVKGREAVLRPEG